MASPLYQPVVPGASVRPSAVVQVKAKEPSFMLRKRHGLPNWAWLTGGLAIGGGAIALTVQLIRRLRRRR